LSERASELRTSATYSPTLADAVETELVAAETSSGSVHSGPFATRIEADDRLRTRLIQLTLARLAIVSIVFAIALVSASGAPTGYVVWTVTAVYVFSIAYAAWLGRGKNLRRLAAVQIALDLFAWIAVAVVTGGPTSPFGFFVAVPALMAALILGSGAARVAAAASAISLGLVTAVFTFRWPHFIAVALPKIELSREEFAVHLTGHAVAIPLVAALGMALAERLKRAGGALAVMEAERAELAVLYENVLRTVPVGLISVDHAGVIEGANPQAATLLGTSAAALLGRSARDTMPWIDDAAFATRTESSAQSAVNLPRDVRYVLWTVTPMRAKGGDAGGYLVMLEDRSAAETLRLKSERDERLAVLGRLAAGLAHEIRNPLGAISGCVQLVGENSAIASEDRELLHTVLKETERLNRLVTDMLAFAKPPTLVRTRVDLRKSLQAFVKIASSEYGSRIIDTSAAVQPEVREVWANVDSAQLQQVLWNLVRNAIQASTQQQPVELWVERQDDCVVLSVADRGQGVSRDSRERIFESFYSETSARGTGLGLAVVRQIVDAHGGSIDVTSRDGGGTVFVISLKDAQPTES
jgi:two-component system sensor histidine kinase PilS (NtrC family)